MLTGFSYKYGVILILCRFLFICGKHVSISEIIFRIQHRIIFFILEHVEKFDNDDRGFGL